MQNPSTIDVEFIESESSMKKWLMSILAAKVIEGDVASATQFAEIAQKKIEENERAEDLQVAYASGLTTVLERLTSNLNVSRDDALTATGIDRDKLDSVYRLALEGAKFAHDLANSEAKSAQREGFQTSFGYIALGHLYRLRWLETQVSGRRLDEVRDGIEKINDLISNVMNIGYDSKPAHDGPFS